MLEIPFILLSERAQMPTYATDGAAGFDLYAALEAPRLLPPGGRALVPLDVAAAVPQGHVLLIFSRSGHGLNLGLRLSNCVGVVDPDYRGGLAVAITNDSSSDRFITPGERIAQGVLIYSERPRLSRVAELPATARGTGGFGSTGRY